MPVFGLDKIGPEATKCTLDFIYGILGEGGVLLQNVDQSVQGYTQRYNFIECSLEI